MAELQICLLGPFQICWDYVALPSSSGTDVLAHRLLMLILVRRPLPLKVAEVVRLMGGGITTHDLAATIEHLRQMLHPAADLLLDGEGLIQFKAGRGCWIDLDALLGHYQSALNALSRGEVLPAILALQEADALYQGELLEEVQEPWVVPLRRSVKAVYTDILDRLAEGHAVLARYQDAIGFCYKALTHDALREDTYQRVMAYAYYLADQAAAREAYVACQCALESVGRQVSAETERLWRRLFRTDPPAVPTSDAAATLHWSRKPEDQ